LDYSFIDVLGFTTACHTFVFRASTVLGVSELEASSILPSGISLTNRALDSEAHQGLSTARELSTIRGSLFDGSFPYGSRNLRQSGNATNSQGLAPVDATVGQIGQNSNGELIIVWTSLAAIVGAAVLVCGGIVLFLIHRHQLSQAMMSDETESWGIELPGDSGSALDDLGNYMSGENALSHDHTHEDADESTGPSEHESRE
jgi:hypothetical protein